MIFGCDRCGRRYSVPDERVQGRAFRVTCKSCGNVIVVRPGAAAPAPQPGPPDLQDPFASAAAATPPGIPAPPAPSLTPPPRAASPPPPAAGAARAARPIAAATGASAARSTVAEDASRSLTTAEMAWMSDGPRRAAADPAPEPEVSVAEPAEAPPRAAGRRGPGMARMVLAAVLLGLAAAAVVAFVVWPGWRGRAPPPPRVAAANPAPPATPAAPLPASVSATPEPAAAPAPAEPPPAPPSPSPRAGAEAVFEPGTVKIGKVRRKEQQYKLTRKDRKLLDLLARKDDQAAPPEPVEKLDLDTARSLDPAAVERVIEESQGAFSGCVTRAAKVAGLPDARRATLLLTVAGTGEVATAWVAEAEVSRTGLGKCLVGAARRLMFPAFQGSPVDVSVPLMLEAR